MSVECHMMLVLVLVAPSYNNLSINNSLDDLCAELTTLRHQMAELMNIKPNEKPTHSCRSQQQSSPCLGCIYPYDSCLTCLTVIFAGAVGFSLA